MNTTASRARLLLFCLLPLVGVLALEGPADALPLHQGDINVDDLINVSDVNCMILATLANAQGEPDPPCQGAPDADVDMQCDGAINVLDVQQVILVRLYLLSGDAGVAALLAVHDPDADGLHNGCDEDDDGDGFSDVCELANATDPRDPASVPTAINACTCPDQCDIGGECVAHGATSASDPCTGCDIDADPVGWTVFEGTGCDDGDPCTTGDTCAAGACEGAPVVCPDDGNSCTVDTCSPADGACGIPFVDGAPCEDGDLCTTGDACLSGACATGGPIACPDDGDPCSADVCDPLTGGCGVPGNDGDPCDDSDPCTVAETCNGGACGPGAAVICPDDGNPCTSESCDPAGSGCTSAALDGVPCSDGDACTSGDACVTGLCVAGAPLSCPDDGDVCTDDVCDPFSGGCGLPVADGADCDDGQVCTVLDTCAQGVCAGAADLELCGNAIDDDCDGDTDEEPCEVVKPGVPDAPVAFAATIGAMAGLPASIGDGKYADRLTNLTKSSESGAVTGALGDVDGGPSPVSVVGGAPAAVELRIASATLWEDAATTRAYVIVRDALGAAPPSGTQVTIAASGVWNGTASCGTDADGRCSADVVVPGAAVKAGGSLTLVAQAGPVSSTPVTALAIASPAPLALGTNEAGIALPLGPRFAGTTFDAPVTVNSGSQTIGSYDVAVAFDTSALTVLDVTAGSETGFGLPVHNVSGDANTTGVLRFNGINEDPASPSGQGPAVHIATVRFQVKAGATAGATAAISGTLVDLFSTGLTNLASDAPLAVHDGTGTGAEGLVTVRGVSIEGLLAWSQRPLLFNLAVPGAPLTSTVTVLGIRTDGSTLALQSDPGTSCTSSAPAVLEAQAGCVAKAGAIAGGATLVATHGAHTAAAPVRVAALDVPLDVRFTDSVLSAIDTGGFQHARARAIATLRDGPRAFTLDVSGSVTWAIEGAAAAVDPQSGVVTAGAPGAATVRALGAGGEELGTAQIAVSATPVSLASLAVLLPADVETLPVAPSATGGAVGQAWAALRVSAFLEQEGGTVGALVMGVYTDDAESEGGSRTDLTGDPGLTFDTDAPSVVTVDAAGLVTAVGSGQTLVRAALTDGLGGTLAEGAGTILVVLPDASAVTVAPSSSSLARTALDTAATHLGLPTTRQLAVTIHYEDGTTADFTNDARTLYDDSTLDPQDLLTVNAAGLVSSTGNGVGTAKIRIGFDGFPPEIATEATFEVVSHQGLALTSWEPYTPSNPRTPEALLSLIEGTSTWQTAKLELIETFTNGATLDVTTAADTVWSVLVPGTQAPSSGVVAVASGTVSALGAGAAELRATSAGHPSPVIPMAVETGRVDIVQLVATVASGATFLGIKDTGTTQMSAYGVLSDGTRRQFTGAALVPGLLAFASSEAGFATITAQGTATIRGNGPATLSVAVAPASDVLTPFGEPVGIAVACNLLPAAGDVDLGNASGLAHPDRAPSEVFEMPVRLHTGGQSLGAFDLELHYDPAVIIATAVTKGTGLGAGATFSGNATTDPGVVYMNGFVSPTAAAVTGSGVEVARVTFQAQKSQGGPAITAVGGTVKQAVALDGTTPIGPVTPRAIIAGAGDLDPDCANDPVLGDANDDCQLAASDGLFVQKLLAGLVTPTPSQQQRSDAFPNGVVDVNDAYFLSRVLARLAHFVEASATPSGTGAYDLIVRLTDRDQLPVDAQVRVRIEVRALANGASLAFSNPHDVTPDGLLVDADPLGGGEFGVVATGLTTPEVGIGVGVIIDVLDPLGVSVAQVAFLGSRVTDPEAGVYLPLITFDVPLAECASLDCDDGDPCTADNCTAETGCTHETASGAACNDGDACTSGDACVVGACIGAPVECPATGDACLLALCDPTTGLCGVAAPDGAPCDDGQACTVPDTCQQGQCSGEPYPACSDPAAGLLCLLSGQAGAEVTCDVQVARSSQGELPAAALQLTLHYDPRLLFQKLSDGVHPQIGVPWTIPSPFSSLQSGHSVSMQPKLPTDWVGSGTLLLSNASDPTAAVTDAWLDQGVVQGDAVLMKAHFVLDATIPPEAPAEIWLTNLSAADQTSAALATSTTGLVIQTSPKP